jgi:quercetin dioxygenase-like cupin family protein
VEQPSFPDRIRALAPFAGPFAAFELDAAGCRVLFASYPAGAAIAEHAHDTENCGVVTRGALYLTVGGVETRVGPGEWYHLPPHTAHAARFDEATEEIEFWFAPRPGP